MKSHLKLAAFMAAVLGLCGSALAQSTGTATGATGTGSTTPGAAGGIGTGTTDTSSPGVTSQNGSETGVAVPGDAPVDPRTREPAQAGTASTMGTGAAAASVESMEGHLGHKAPSKELSKGLAALHAANQAEIMSGHSAQQIASSPDVKVFAARMVTDHTLADQQLESMSSGRVDLVGSAFQSAEKEATKRMKDLEGKTGSAFDEAYIFAMVRDHQKAASEVQTLAAQAKKEGQSGWATYLDQLDETIRSHLSDAHRLQSSLPSASTANDSATTGTGAAGGTDASGGDTKAGGSE